MFVALCVVFLILEIAVICRVESFKTKARKTKSVDRVDFKKLWSQYDLMALCTAAVSLFAILALFDSLVIGLVAGAGVYWVVHWNAKRLIHDFRDELLAKK